MSGESPRSPPARGDRASTAGRLDELLDDPPAISTRGALAAYAEGSRVRRKIYIALVAGAALAVAAGRWYVQRLQHARDNPTAEYTVATGAEDEIRPRRLQWNGGFAHLALSRDPPGVDEIVLPDRIVRLAPGSDTAQLKVNVVDGRTVQFKVLTGEVSVIETGGS